MKKFNLLVSFILVSLFTFNSCRKGTDGDNTELNHVILNNTGEVLSNDVFKMFLYNMMAAEDSIFTPNDSMNFHYSEPCLQFSISPYDTITWPKTITLAFPESGCYCSDGNIRGGQLIITANGLLNTPGSEFSITFNNYSVNGISFSGNKKISVAAISSDIADAFNDSTNFNISSLSGSRVWNSEHYIQWILGANTISDLTDDLFIYNGNSRGESYSGTITDALQFINNCFWVGSGQIEITPTALSKRQVTYLDSCLNQADVIINNETFRVNF
jgi:hypothetical protein